MGYAMSDTAFVQKLKNIALNYKTLYVMGCFGAPLTSKNKRRYTQNDSYNMMADRTKMINNASDDTFGFDCVCLIKAVLWGWNGNSEHIYGGASYESHNVPDVNADQMMNMCSDISTNFKTIKAGEAVGMKGHIGVYIGNGLVVECTPKWKNCVQITALGNTGGKLGYNSRTWTRHGKLPWVKYTVDPAVKKIGVSVIEKVLRALGRV